MSKCKFFALLLSIMLVFIVACPFAIAEPRTSAEKEALYAAAIDNLEAYLESSDYHDAPDLMGIADSFRQLGRYEQSQWLMYYTQVMIRLQTDTYDYEMSMLLEIMDKNDEFKEYLSEALKGSSIGEIDKLQLYVEGRRAEFDGCTEDALSYYNQCLSFYDSQERYRKLRSGQDKEMYMEATEKLSSGDLAGAYYAYGGTNSFEDSDVRRTAIISMLGYIPENEQDNPEPVKNLKTEVGMTSVSISWEKAKHATGYRITLQKNDNETLESTEQTENKITYNGLQPASTYRVSIEALFGKITAQPCTTEITTRALTPSPSPTAKPTAKPSPTKKITPTPKPTLEAVPAPTKVPTSIKPGDIVTFGLYEQDNIIKNGKEPIEWQVLEAQDNKLLLMSRYALDYQEYSEKDFDQWSTCILRSWLNKDFIAEAFTKGEQIAIIPIDVKNRDYWEPLKSVTQDQIFLLDEDECWQYFDDYSQLVCEPTKKVLALVKDRYPRFNTKALQREGRRWLMRTGMVIGDDGVSTGCIASTECTAIRPVLWLDTDIIEPPVKEKAATERNQKDSTKVKKGNIVLYGHYEQDADLKNGKESIEWVVLDVRGGKALLLSRRGLTCRPFDNAGGVMNWENSPIRQWLNDEFIQESFSDRERDSILTTKVENTVKQGNFSAQKTTQDRLFLLSAMETKTYPLALSVVCKAVPAAKTSAGYGFSCNWWLRTAGYSSSPKIIDIGGGGGWGSDAEHVAVRPAMWVKLSSGALPR